jgi:hypothetical protein
MMSPYRKISDHEAIACRFEISLFFSTFVNFHRHDFEDTGRRTLFVGSRFLGYASDKRKHRAKSDDSNQAPFHQARALTDDEFQDCLDALLQVSDGSGYLAYTPDSFTYTRQQSSTMQSSVVQRSFQ